MSGKNWSAVVWDLVVEQWPSSVEEFWSEIRCLLESLAGTSQVADLAWTAKDFSDPPSLFKEKDPSSLVYAAHSPELGFLCNSLHSVDLLSPGDLARLRAVRALAACTEGGDTAGD